MAMNKYVITGRGSVTRYEDAEGKPILGTVPSGAHLVRHEKDENPVLLLDDEVAKKPQHAHLGFRLWIAGEVSTAPKAAHAKAKAGEKKPGDAEVSSNIG